MKQNQQEGGAYRKPEIEIVATAAEPLLNSSKFNGGHNPGHIGGGGGDAKEGFFDESEEENAWED